MADDDEAGIRKSNKRSVADVASDLRRDLGPQEALRNQKLLRRPCSMRYPGCKKRTTAYDEVTQACRS